MDRLTIFLFHLLGRLPLGLLQTLGAGLGWLAALLPGRMRRITRRNLELCFPELPEAERLRIARRSLIEAGKTMLEMPLFWTSPARRVLGHIRESVGEAQVREALAAGRGVIVAGPHLGAWEVLGLYLGANYPMNILYRPPRSAALDRMIRDSRARTGGRVVATDAKGVRTLFKAIANGEVLGILPDQDPGYKAGVFVPFFGIPTITMTLLSRLAAKSDALVVLGFAERLPRGRGFRLHFRPIDPAINDPDPATSAAALNRAIEEAIRLYPTQYQWSYKRFRRRPEGEPDIY